MGVILALLIFSFIVFFHELGHFLLAKRSGIRVDEFSVGMGPRLLSTVRGETRYSLKLLPIGGSCMMGEDDGEDTSEGSFNSKPVLARMATIVAGPVFNFILAFAVSIILISWLGIDIPVVGEVMEGYPAENSGLQSGDRIVKMNDKKIHIFRDIYAFNAFNQGQEVELVYERDGKEYVTAITPQESEEGGYLLGLNSSGYVKGNILEVMSYSLYEVKYTISSTLESLKMLVTGGVGIDQMSGPVGIVDMVGDVYESSRPAGIAVVFLNLLNLTVMLSSTLGIMNLLPFPALDGGRLVFLILEAIRGKRVPPEKEGMVHFVGIMLLFALMAVVMFNDIRRIFF